MTAGYCFPFSVPSTWLSLEIQETEFDFTFSAILKIILPVFVVFSFFNLLLGLLAHVARGFPAAAHIVGLNLFFFFILEEIKKGINAQSARHVGLEVVTTPHAMAFPTEVSGGSGVILQQMEQN